MADLEMHWTQAEHNRALAISLSKGDPIVYKDWVIVAGFYAAVHYVEARLTLEDEGHSDGQEHAHRFRVSMVGKYYCNKCNRAYRKLYRMSLLMRYLVAYNPDSGVLETAAQATGAWMDDATVRGSFVTAIESIRTETAARLNKAI